MLTPFPPYQIRLLAPKFGAGMDQGKTKRTGNTAWHSMLGSLNGTDTYFRRLDIAASTHWGIGGSLDGNYDGVIYQWVQIGSDRIPWASGPWRAPGYGDGSDYVNQYGVYGINAYAESIEFSGMLETPMTVKQWLSGMWLTAAIAHAGGYRSDTAQLWNMHHREFTQPSFKDCPFERIYLYTDAYQQGIRYIMAHYEGKSVPDFVKIAGLHVPLPLGQVVTDPKDTTPVFVPFNPVQIGKTVANATGRQWGNRDAEILRTYRAGESVRLVGYYRGGEKVGGNDIWYVEDSAQHLRIHASGFSSIG